MKQSKKVQRTSMPAKRNFGRCTSSQLSAESPVTREIEERIHKQAETHTHTPV